MVPGIIQIQCQVYVRDISIILPNALAWFTRILAYYSARYTSSIVPGILWRHFHHHAQCTRSGYTTVPGIPQYQVYQYSSMLWCQVYYDARYTTNIEPGIHPRHFHHNAQCIRQVYQQYTIGPGTLQIQCRVHFSARYTRSIEPGILQRHFHHKAQCTCHVMLEYTYCTKVHQPVYGLVKGPSLTSAAQCALGQLQDQQYLCLYLCLYLYLYLYYSVVWSRIVVGSA